MDIKLTKIGKVALRGRPHDRRAGARRPPSARRSSDPAADRKLAPGARRPSSPKVTTAGLAKAYGTIVTIDRGNFKLRLFKNLKLSKTYGVAVGMPGYPTPTGRYTIANKAVNPAWTAPNSPWAGAYAQRGRARAARAENPLKARWLGIVNGVGIHGTGAPGSIGIARLARLHPHDRAGRDRPVSPRAGRDAGPDRKLTRTGPARSG